MERWEDKVWRTYSNEEFVDKLLEIFYGLNSFIIEYRARGDRRYVPEQFFKENEIVEGIAFRAVGKWVHAIRVELLSDELYPVEKRKKDLLRWVSRLPRGEDKEFQKFEIWKTKESKCFFPEPKEGYAVWVKTYVYDDIFYIFPVSEREEIGYTSLEVQKKFSEAPTRGRVRFYYLIC